jgi:acetyltransferase-like isoleucine patch superfamily enzyme
LNGSTDVIETVARLIRRLKALKHVRIEGSRARFLFAKNVNIRCAKGAKIIVRNGIVRLGYPLPRMAEHSCFPTTEITLGENATLVFEGDVCIAGGATIIVGANAKATFAGNNFIANNFKLLCNREFRFGRFANASWGVTLIDDDKHRFRRADGKELRSAGRPLLIGDNVGLQMNVSIPRGVTIGENSVVASGLVLRQDIPANCTVFGDVTLKVKHGIGCGPTPDRVN